MDFNPLYYDYQSNSLPYYPIKMNYTRVILKLYLTYFNLHESKIK